MAITKLSENIRNGEISSVMRGLYSKAGLYRAQAIISVANYNMMSDQIKERLIELKDDNIDINGYTVSDFAIAAMHKLGIREYKGDKPSVLLLIRSEKWFE